MNNLDFFKAFISLFCFELVLGKKENGILSCIKGMALCCWVRVNTDHILDLESGQLTESCEWIYHINTVYRANDIAIWNDIWELQLWTAGP
jgi:hypothetical protein